MSSVSFLYFFLFSRSLHFLSLSFFDLWATYGIFRGGLNITIKTFDILGTELDPTIIFAISGTHLTFSCFFIIRYFSLSFSAVSINSLNLSPHKVFTMKIMALDYLRHTYVLVPLPAGVHVVFIFRQVLPDIWVPLRKLHDVSNYQVLQIWDLDYLYVFAWDKLY